MLDESSSIAVHAGAEQIVELKFRLSGQRHTLEDRGGRASCHKLSTVKVHSIDHLGNKAETK